MPFVSVLYRVELYNTCFGFPLWSLWNETESSYLRMSRKKAVLGALPWLNVIVNTQILTLTFAADSLLCALEIYRQVCWNWNRFTYYLHETYNLCMSYTLLITAVIFPISPDCTEVWHPERGRVTHLDWGHHWAVNRRWLPERVKKRCYTLRVSSVSCLYSCMFNARGLHLNIVYVFPKGS